MLFQDLKRGDKFIGAPYDDEGWIGTYHLLMKTGEHRAVNILTGVESHLPDEMEVLKIS